MIDSYSFGKIEVDGVKYSNDLKIFPDEVKDKWWRKEGHEIHPEDIEDILEFSPDVLILGTGAYGKVEVPEKTVNVLRDKGIEMIAEKTEDACQKYNEICDDGKVVAALHLTC